MKLRRYPAIAVASAALAGLTLSAAGLPAADAASIPSARQVPAAPSQRYIVRVQGDDAALSAVAGAVTGAGGRVLGTQTTLHTVVVSATADVAAALRRRSGVLAVVPDQEAKAQSLGFDWNGQPGSMTSVSRATTADNVWGKGYTGNGVDVALIDTGVAPVSGLLDPVKVVVGPDLSFESQTVGTRYLDSFGHGTNMAGIIAGREVAKGTGAAYRGDGTNFYGMAPDARLVSLKLADHSGSVDVSQIIAAIDWVVKYRQSNGLNIRVLNLSYGVYSKQNAQLDPLSWATEQAWKAGITVVASTGNDGGNTVGLASPAYNPWVIAVGAADTNGTETQADDTVPAFSEKAVAGSRGPDVVAPGVGIVSLGVPGSKIYTDYPKARFGNGFMRGSGTSQAAAVVSGGLALMLQQYPTLTPDDVKKHLRATATKLAGIADTAQGAGEVNFQRASDNAPPSQSTQSVPRGTGTGTLELARGDNHVVINGKQLSGEFDVMYTPWNSTNIAAATTGGTIWSSDGKFNGALWIGNGFVSDTTSWAGKTWQGKTWQGKTWQGDTWTGRTWQSGTWSSTGWSSSAWTAPVAPSSFASATWSSAGWQ